MGLQNRKLSVDVARTFRSFQRDSHAISLIHSILHECNDDVREVQRRIGQANRVVTALRKVGVPQFFAAEYAKLFPHPRDALGMRKDLIAHFVQQNHLSARQSARLTDCIAFSMAKEPHIDRSYRLTALSSKALELGVPFSVVYAAVYDNPPNFTGKMFARCCMQAYAEQERVGLVSERSLAISLGKLLS